MNAAGGAGSAGTAGASDVGGTSNAGAADSGGASGSSAGGQAGTVGAGGSGGTSASGGADGGGVSSAGGADGTAEPGLVASPDELVFGAVQQTQTMPQTIALKNPSSVAVQLASVMLDAAAAGTPTFELVSGPRAGAVVAAGASTDVQIRFHPTGVALFKSSLQVATQDPNLKLSIGLYGLGTKGLEGENEPSLKMVLDTLGFDINVGGTGLLGTTTPLMGDEVAAPRFKAVSAAEVELVPVARYSPEEPIPYGWYDAASETQVGVIADDQYQALNPKTDAGSKLGFAAPTGEFGIFTNSKTHKTYTEDAKNAANATKHAVRTYPLKDRAGNAITNAYLLCFEEAANGDYQDYVFTLSNVTPVAP
jgi:hypothetical protein